MSAAGTLTLVAPLAGWSTALEEAPDEVFAARLLGDGVAIDPTAGTLHAPCDAEIVLLPASRHAVTLRTAAGCDVLLHVGIDTVTLGGEGFQAHVREGDRVRAGDALLTFDLDFLARRARSVLTPIIITTESGWEIRKRSLDRLVAAGEWLMEVAAQQTNPIQLTPATTNAPSFATRRLRVSFEHGIHARPAALLARSLRPLAADVRLLARGREANARSTVALMALGVQHGEEIEIRASGADAHNALDALTAVFGARAAPGESPTSSARPASPQAAVAQHSTASASPVARGVLRGVTASPGLAVGRALQLQRPEILLREMGAGVAEEALILDAAEVMTLEQLGREHHLGALRRRFAHEFADRADVLNGVLGEGELEGGDGELAHGRRM